YLALHKSTGWNRVKLDAMSLHRVAISLRRLRVLVSHFSSTAGTPSSSGNVDLFREINKFASEGKWDSINNAPKLFLFSKDRSDVYRVYHQLVGLLFFNC
uniref:Uncharacterized protein n=1 Tax=Parascaris univalens TaxID=6257 RepID=A0A915CH66_PARUN